MSKQRELKIPTKPGFYWASHYGERTIVKMEEVAPGKLDAYVFFEEMPRPIESFDDWSDELEEPKAISAKLKKMIAQREESLKLAEGAKRELRALLVDVRTKINTPLNGLGISLVSACIALVLAELSIRDERKPKILGADGEKAGDIHCG